MIPNLPEEVKNAVAKALRESRWLVPAPAVELILTAALPFLSVQGAVKKLEWGNARITEDGREAEDAESPVGRYIATDTGWFLLGRTGYEVERGLYQAKSAAQADYEARILSALEPSAARELALEEVVETLEYVDRMFRLDLSKYTDWDGDDFNQAIFDTHQRVKKALRALSSPDHADADTLETYYARQIEWSKNTFGPALRTKGIIDHIKKELKEIEAEPHDLSEWIDVVILAMDGFWRHGGTADDLMPRLLAKQQKNMARTWPDWRTMSEDQAIEHDRSLDADHADAGKVEGDGRLPIESAPKDGTEIIYLTKYGSIGFCRYAVDDINDWFGWWDLQADDEVYPKFWLSRSTLPSAPSEGAE